MHMMNPMEELRKWTLVLGSASPRRQELIKGLGIPVRISPSDIDETVPELIPPELQPEYLAIRKGDACTKPVEWECLITSDTSVLLNGEILNKPADESEALAMLKKLSGRYHDVYTGVCLRTSTEQRVFTEVSRVHFKEMSDAEYRYYVSKYNPYDKAGSYGIQEWIGYVAVDRIEGCFFNVMGLPLSKLYSELKILLLN
ncbi:MAG: septum formation protein Maf [Flavobacteriales bacterium]|nr:septum formation protein Maf [Flavobacteriales bacterium]